MSAAMPAEAVTAEAIAGPAALNSAVSLALGAVGREYF